MKTLKINKSDWSGEEIEIKLYKDGKTGSIPDYDLKFKVVLQRRYIDDNVRLDQDDFTIELNDGEGWQKTDWNAVTDRNIGTTPHHYHIATNWNRSISRESTEDIRIAVAQLICNLY